MIRFDALWSLTKESVSQWSEDFAPSMGAALAYYTIFSIAPLLIIAIAVAGFFFGDDAARGQIFAELRGMLGDQGATAIEATVKSASQTGSGTFAAIIGVVTLLLGATSVFGELQSDLDRIWNAPKPEHAGLLGLLRGRLLSFGMVLGIGFLLLVSLVLSAALSALGHYSSRWFPGWELLMQGVNFVIGFIVVTGLFAMIYKLLPRCDIAWSDVWVGATVTSLLFSVGKLLIGLYLGKSSAASSFGAAGSLVIVLLWIYYSSQIFLLGAEFTYAYSYRHGTRKAHVKPAVKGPAAASGRGGKLDTPEAQTDDSDGPDLPARNADRAPKPAAIPGAPMPAFAKLRIAAGIAATIGLIAGEVLNRLPQNPRIARRPWSR